LLFQNISSTNEENHTISKDRADAEKPTYLEKSQTWP
jgi:hypothetical protein